MIVLLATLLVLHQGYSLVPVLTVQFGEPVTITCVLSAEDFSSRDIRWYKQRAGDTLESIVTLKKKSAQYGPGFSERLEVKTENYFSNLTILRTITEDEGMYHCGITEWIKTRWSGTYLLVKGNSERTSNYTVVQTVSDPVRPGDSVTLQCSVLSDSDNKTCPGDHSVYWFRAGSDQSHPEIIYTGGNNECEKRSDSVKSCVHHFSKTVSSSDTGTYYCAVATCGQILFGDGTNPQIKQNALKSEFIALVISLVCLAISVIGNIVLICYQKRIPVFKG
ncbi:prostaglandin F2 receptor negative regulator-like [Anabas testudineus]|uniref:prostaglandin F2 receptor negative regulator-like n=1 Tax=Anabas testudineus TaxID=64144 RepID=UPI000E458C51|nr:prostaglandin F2 receptor negative regulator-like [Anabas testudineus]